MVNMRPFNEFEQKNLKFLVNHNVKFTQVEVTATGLKRAFWTLLFLCVHISWNMEYTTMRNKSKDRNIKQHIEQ